MWRPDKAYRNILPLEDNYFVHLIDWDEREIRMASLERWSDVVPNISTVVELWQAS